MLAVGSAWSGAGLVHAADKPGEAVAPSAPTAVVNVDRRTQYQTIEGFGFFGARDVWWTAPERLLDPQWLDLVIDDLGLTVWRNEYFPPADHNGPQDATWEEQRPFVEALRDRAAASHVPLKTLLTVWSAPAELKCAADFDRVYDGFPHPGGTVGGGAVCPSLRQAFAEWLIAGVRNYADLGISVYGLSLQNEPLFAQGFNSSAYPRAVYAETLEQVGPWLHSAFPNLRLFGAENMLEIETGRAGEEFDPFWYTQFIFDNPGALEQLNAFAVHGILDGAFPVADSLAARRWRNFYNAVAPTRHPVWMTETSGYVDGWEEGVNGNGIPRLGAFDYAQAIFSALYYGKASLWSWWQGSQRGGLTEFSLMDGTTVGKRYAVSKHFSRFIRPGARMVATQSEDAAVLAAAFEHPEIGNFVTVLINGADSERVVRLQGKGVPRGVDVYITSATETLSRPRHALSRSIVLPPRSLATVIAGSYLDPVPNPRKRCPPRWH
jgi:glucuronoarabinoxylan endo-1,4-beta-xylanase